MDKLSRALITTTKAGIGVVFIDTEHVPIVRDTLSWMCQAFDTRGVPPLVRVPEPEVCIPVTSTMNLKLCMLCTQMVTRQCSTGQSCFQQPCHRMFIVGHPPDYVPRLQPYRVTEYLDAGARGIVAPYLESVEQAKMLVGATKLRPLKGTPFPLSRNRTKNRLSQSCQR